MVLIIKERATLEQVEEMLQTLRIYIKVAVDIEQRVRQITQELIGGYHIEFK